MHGKRDGRITNISEALDGYLRARGYVRMSREHLIPVVWPEVVGDWYRQHTQVLRVEQGVVTVGCDSPARAQQLQLDSAYIIKALNARVGGRAVKELRPTSAGIRPTELSAMAPDVPAVPVPTRRDLEAMELDDCERNQITETVQGIHDPDLRRLVEAALAKHLKELRWKRTHGYVPCCACGSLIPPSRAYCVRCAVARQQLVP